MADDDRFDEEQASSEIENEAPEAPEPSRGGWLTKSTWVALAVLFGLACFMFGILAQREVFTTDGIQIGGSSDEGADKVDTVMNLLEGEYYYRPTDPEASPFAQTLEDNAIHGMTAGLNDDYTMYLEPAQNAPIAEQMSGEYEGIGVWVDYPDGQVRIIAPMPGSPAEQAGLKSGDILLEADGTSLKGLSDDQTLSLIRGPAGTTVKLTVQREGEPQPLVLDVTRAKITTPSVIYTRVGPNGSIAHIAVTVFGDNTTAQLDAALQQAKRDGVTSVVLDLRNNGGGWVKAAQEMIGRFVTPEHGPALYEDDDPTDTAMQSEPILAGDVNAYDLPMVVLVNEGTASASEIVTGALRDYNRATIIGENTYGKGVVQTVHNFDDGSSLRVTSAEWLTPAKSEIQGVGIPPSIVVADDNTTEADEQLNAAIQALSSSPDATPQASPSPVS